MMKKQFRTIDLVATGLNIVRLRKERGLSVKDLQEYFCFDGPQAIYKWQWGKSLPSVDNLFALAYLFEVPMESILVSSDAASGAAQVPDHNESEEQFPLCA